MKIITDKAELANINAGNEVRSIFDLLSREEKIWFGGLPFSANINHEINNYFLFGIKNMPNRPRVALGLCSLNKKKQVIAFISATVMNNANPTEYERERIFLQNKLNYIHCKKIIVHPDFWGQGISMAMLNQIKTWAKILGKELMTDINQQNTRMYYFCRKSGINNKYCWHTLGGSPMYRIELTT